MIGRQRGLVVRMFDLSSGGPALKSSFMPLVDFFFFLFHEQFHHNYEIFGIFTHTVTVLKGSKAVVF